MPDPDAAIASIHEVLNEYEARLAVAEEALVEREQRLAQIAQLAHVEPPVEQPAG